MILKKHKPIMENPVRDTKVTMVEVSQMRRLGRRSHVKRRLPTRRIFVTGVLVDDDHNNTTTTTTELSVGTTTTSPVVVVVPLLSSSSRRRKVYTRNTANHNIYDRSIVVSTPGQQQEQQHPGGDIGMMDHGGWSRCSSAMGPLPPSRFICHIRRLLCAT